MKITLGVEENEDDQPSTVVVGIKMDAESRELLTWALVKVAKPGDRVVALHVIPSDSEEGRCNSLLALVKAFDSVLAVYDGFCNLKQIDLKLKLCRGSSIRKVLVREAHSYGATDLLLGINKHCHGIRYASTSIARYCAKKVSKDCAVLAVNNGKIVFAREAMKKKSCLLKSHDGKCDYLLAIEGQQTKSTYASRPSFHCLPTVTKPRLLTNRDDMRDRHDCSVCSGISSSSSSSTEDRRDQNCSKSRKDESLALVPLSRSNLHGIRTGWALLRKAVLTDKKTNNVHEKCRASVNQWPARLPSRYTLAPTIHSDSEHAKSIAPVGRTDSPGSPLSIHDEVKELPIELRALQEKYSSVCRLFSYEELKHATSNFSFDNLIGRGGGSQVYKGRLSNGNELAVKLLKQSDDALKEFVSEIEIITTLHHNNIISLVGFCFDNVNLILVYNFLSRGSLEEILHGKKENTDALSWVERYKIAVGVAEALDYLHGGGSAQPVIHRDVKSSNILLSEDFDPQLADFGLALWASSSSSHMTCNDVAGTFGYLAPEYFMYGKVTEKIDVYAFGVVLLELLSGRKPVNAQGPKGEESLVLWAKKILQDGKVKELVDPILGYKLDNDQMERIILVASLCIRKVPRARPRMALILKLLQGDADALNWAKSQVNDSEELVELDDEVTNPTNNIQSHIYLALLNLEDDTLSASSPDPSVDFITTNTSLEDYLKGRWSRSSSFD